MWQRLHRLTGMVSTIPEKSLPKGSTGPSTGESCRVVLHVQRECFPPVASSPTITHHTATVNALNQTGRIPVDVKENVDPVGAAFAAAHRAQLVNFLQVVAPQRVT